MDFDKEDEKSFNQAIKNIMECIFSKELPAPIVIRKTIMFKERYFG